MKYSKLKKGFTLIELLIVMVMIGSITVIVVGVLASTLRGTNKANVINKVRENGNYAISQISRTIKYAKIIEGTSTSAGGPFTCQSIPQPPSPTPASIQHSFVRATAFDGTVTTFACETDTISSNTVPLIDGGPNGSVSIAAGSCYFTCYQGFIDSPQIGINFILNAKTTSALVETQASIPFSTTVKGRN